MNHLKNIYYKLFSGRIRNVPFLFAVLSISILQFFTSALFDTDSTITTYSIRAIFIVMVLSLEVRRLHDLDLPGYLAIIKHIIIMLKGFSPFSQQLMIAGFIFDIYLMFASGKSFTNKYGERPKLEKKFLHAVLNK